MDKLVSIQYLRAVAAMMVVVVHFAPALKRLGYEGNFPYILASGVDIFFIISGVVMWISTCSQKVNPVDFLLRRIIRIVPMYYLITAFIVVVMIFLPSAVNNGEFNLPHAVASFFFVAWEHPMLKGHIYPVLVPGWTINYEMFFYPAFAVTLLLSTRSRIWAIFLFFVALVIAGNLLKLPNNENITFYTRSILFEFVFGLLIGRLVETARFVSASWGLVFLLVGIGSLAFFQIAGQDLETENFDRLYRVLFWGLPAAFIVYGAVSLERAGAMIESLSLRRLGDASYSIYLVHTVIISAVGFVFSHSHFPPAILQTTFAPVCTIAVIGIGYITFTFVEAPTTRCLLRLRRPKSTIVNSPAKEAEAT